MTIRWSRYGGASIGRDEKGEIVWRIQAGRNERNEARFFVRKGDDKVGDYSSVRQAMDACERPSASKDQPPVEEAEEQPKAKGRRK